MRFSLLIGIVVLSLPAFILAQPFPPDTIWTKTYGGSGADGTSFVIGLETGECAATGFSNSFGGGDFDVYLLKTDSNGDTIWTNTYGSTVDEWACCMALSGDNGLVLLVNKYYSASNINRILLIKTDQYGDSLWSQEYALQYEESPLYISKAIDDGYIIAGYTTLYSNYNLAGLLIKTDEDGFIDWYQTFVGSHASLFSCVEQTYDHNYIACGWIEYVTGVDINFDVYLVKTDSSGILLWERNFDERFYDTGYSVIKTADMGYIITGVTGDDVFTNIDVLLIKTDSTGNEVWRNIITFNGNDDGIDIVETLDNCYVIIGTTDSFGAGGADALVIKVDESGDTLWTKTIGGVLDDYANSIVETDEGDFIIAGSTESFGAGESDAWLIKLDNEGNSVEFLTPNHPFDYELNPAYPNPFNSSTSISFIIPMHSKVSIDLYDISGRYIKGIADGEFSAGEHRIDINGNSLPSGVYFVRMTAGSFDECKKIVLMN